MFANFQKIFGEFLVNFRQTVSDSFLDKLKDNSHPLLPASLYSKTSKDFNGYCIRSPLPLSEVQYGFE